LLNWCKCVGRNNLNNVLYPSFFLHCSYINSTIWFISFLIEMLTGFWNNLSNFRTLLVLLKFNLVKEFVVQ
jgi:hypothetical protein